MAGNRTLVMCPPLCKGPLHIVQSGSTYFVNGVPVAQDGMKTACCISPPLKPADKYGATPPSKPKTDQHTTPHNPSSFNTRRWPFGANGAYYDARFNNAIQAPHTAVYALR